MHSHVRVCRRLPQGPCCAVWRAAIGAVKAAWGLECSVAGADVSIPRGSAAGPAHHSRSAGVMEGSIHECSFLAMQVQVQARGWMLFKVWDAAHRG